MIIPYILKAQTNYCKKQPVEKEICSEQIYKPKQESKQTIVMEFEFGTKMPEVPLSTGD